MVVMVTPVAFNGIGYNTYTVFACINAFIVPVVYFFYPETAGRSLEEMDEIFQDVHGFKGAFDVVKVSLTKQRRFGKKGELLINYAETERARSFAERRASSVAAQGGRGPLFPGMPQEPKVERNESQHYEEKSDSSH
jgi:hypothetical protein